MTFEDVVTLSGPLALLVALTMAGVEAVKRTLPSVYTDENLRWVPLTAILVGEVVTLGASLTFGTLPLQSVPFVGLVVGLASIGLYSGTRATLGR